MLMKWFLFVLVALTVDYVNEPTQDIKCLSAGNCYPKQFVPTTEYTRIMPDQHIPPGLDVRMDMQTGQSYARIPQKTRTTFTTTPEPNKQTINSFHSSRPTALSTVIQDVKNPAELPPPASPPTHKPSKFIGHQTHSLNKSITDLFDMINQSQLADDHVEYWDTLEELTHHVDHGIYFIRCIAPELNTQVNATGVFDRLVNKLDSHDNLYHAVQFYRILGNTLQNNEIAVQLIVSHIPNLLPHLITCVNTNVHQTSTGRVASWQVAKSCLHALGSLVRCEPTLRHEFIHDHNALTLLNTWGQSHPGLLNKCHSLSNDLSS